ncbi:anthranilate synthase component I family protein [Bifidobacterium sp. ESL0690]|uniref:anthranilate synthase component I family protein n=1 Tax=Bifidobacterium sp. ESL0690 TaxID=2983214 RepID=UPI0023F67E01|nr:anthranilate synthase component I family protein [Bifidobacterium sp. ESL0690]WEV46962.1 anthranilate synthase component I family protein [Bifidobacterium sp. ESL0690]
MMTMSTDATAGSGLGSGAVVRGAADESRYVGIRPTLDEVRELAKSGKYRRIPVMRELLADRLTTIEAMRRVRAASNHCFLLESAEADQRMGRYSFLGFAPTLELTCKAGNLTIKRVAPAGSNADDVVVEHKHVDHPSEAIRKVLAQYSSPRLEGFPPFAGGLVGYFSFGYLAYAEPTLRQETRDPKALPDVDLMLFDQLISFDSYRQRLQLIAGVDTSDVDASYERAVAQIEQMQEILDHGKRYDFKPLELDGELELTLNREQYGSMIRKAKEHIYAGDIFQVVLSNPSVASASGSLFDAYRLMRAENPSPYMVFMSSDDIEIAAASPETLVRLEDGKLLTYPLAGTRPRGATPEEDKLVEQDLLSDEKELAEHNMLVDLGRNDIGRVSKLGSVEVERLHDILRFSHVMHIGSTVAGQLADGKDALDVIDAVLPAGTLSGAPKIRACQIIAELEDSPRDIYGGAIGYLDFSGNLDICIGIRLAFKHNGKVCVQSGAGIVADSNPDKEFEECRNKALAVVDAINEANGGIA